MAFQKPQLDAFTVSLMPNYNVMVLTQTVMMVQNRELRFPTRDKTAGRQGYTHTHTHINTNAFDNKCSFFFSVLENFGSIFLTLGCID